MTIAGEEETQGAFLKRMRSLRDLTQKEVAEGARVSIRTVMRAENGHAIEWDNLMSICSVLEVDARSVPSTASSSAEGDALEVEVLEEVREAITFGDEDFPEHDFERSDLSPHEAVDRVEPAPHLHRPARPNYLAHAMAMVVVTVVTFGLSGILSPDPAVAKRDAVVTDQATLATDVATRVNRVAAAIAAGSEESFTKASIDMAKEIWPNAPCYPACSSMLMDNAVARLEDGSALVTLGALSQTTFTGIVQLITRDTRLDIRIAITPTYGADQRGTLWLDPRGVRTDQLPPFSDTDYLHVRIRP